MSSITILIADHDPARQSSCLRLLAAEQTVEVLGVVTGGLEAIAATAELKPRILLFDFNLLQQDAALLLSSVRRNSPSTRVILLTDCLSEAEILETLLHGAAGYIDTNNIAAFLLKAIRAVDEGEAWLPRRMLAEIVNRLNSDPA